MKGNPKSTDNRLPSVTRPDRLNRRKRIFRITAVALLTSLAAYLTVNLALAGLFAFILTHPICNQHPSPPVNLPTPEEYWLHTGDGLTLRAWYYPSENGAAILTLGGQGGSLGDNLPPAAFLANEGYGVLQIDTRACAQTPAAVTLGGDEVYDAVAGFNFLQALPEIDKIGAFGFSMGGATAIRVAARHPEIAAVVAEGNYYNLGDHLTGADQPLSFPQRIFQSSIAGAYWIFSGTNPWLLSPIDDLPRLNPRPVFLIYGEHEATSGRAQEQFTHAGEPKLLWIVPNGSHGRNHLIAQEEYQQRILDFFNNAFFDTGT